MQSAVPKLKKNTGIQVHFPQGFILLYGHFWENNSVYGSAKENALRAFTPPRGNMSVGLHIRQGKMNSGYS